MVVVGPAVVVVPGVVMLYRVQQFILLKIQLIYVFSNFHRKYFLIKTYVGVGVLPPPDPEQRATLFRDIDSTLGAGAPLKRI